MPVILELTSDEALVLFEMMHRFSETDVFSVKDPSEQQALWNLCCLLEKQDLMESPGTTYEEALSGAKARLVE